MPAKAKTDELVWVPLASFEGYCKAATVNSRDGEFVLTIAVRREDKYEAMPVTDHEGVTFRFEVTRPDYGGE